MRVLSDADVVSVLELEDLLPVVEEALVAQGAGAVEHPPRPHFPVGAGLEGAEPLGTGLVMPAYVHGARYYATKLVGVHEGNAERGLPTVNATIALTEAATGLPAAYLAGTRITNARTGCVGGLAARELAPPGPVDLGIIGAGAQARWQARAIAAATDLQRVRVYSPSDSRESCAADLRERGLDATAVGSARAAVEGASVVVTATTATEPVFPGDALASDVLVVAVGAYTAEMRELDAETVDGADAVYADVPEEASETGDLAHVDPERVRPLSEVVADRNGPDRERGRTVVCSVGSAVFDAAAAARVVERALAEDVGREVDV